MSRTPRIGRFEIVEELGTGSMGVVYLARDPVIGRWVAVKKLTGIKGKSLDPDTVRRLLINEARSVGALEHPGILTVFDIVEDRDGKVEALAMEFVRGRSLRQRLDEPDPIPLKQIGEIMTAVAEALDYAHESGCVHRDVKPANVLLGDDGAIKIADFGISALRGEDLATELLNLGTPNYLAPERVLGQPGDRLTDIYSLGVILYELLTRRLPFEATSIAELVQKIVRDEPTPPRQLAPSLLPGFEAVLTRALAKEPEDRFETAGAMALAVAQIVDAQAALNDTVPAPMSLLSQSAEPVEEEESRPLTLVPQAEPEPTPEAPSVLEATVHAPLEELLSIPEEAEMEEVQWESAVPEAPKLDPQARPTEVVRDVWAKAGLALLAAASGASSFWHWSSAWLGRGLAILRDRPALTAASVFAVALPLMLLLSGGSDEVKATEQVDESAVTKARRQVVGLLVESRSLFESGDEAGARALLHQADLLFPVGSPQGAGRMYLAAEREVDRLDRIDRTKEEARLQIARTDFGAAKRSIDALSELGAPEQAVLRLTNSLSEARRRVRRSRQAPRPEPEITVARPVRNPVPARVASVPKPPALSGPGRLRIEFTSAKPRGVLTVFADGKQVLNRRYRFVERQKLLLRKGIGGSFEESIELPEGTRSLKLYLTQPRKKAQYRPITVEIPAGKSTTLSLAVHEDGRFVVNPG